MIEKYSNMSPREKNIFETILIISLAAIFLLGSLIGNLVDARKEQKESMKTVLVTDNSRYFTVIGCAKKYLSYLKDNSTEEILTILNEEYKESNRILASNLYTYVPRLNKDTIYDYVGEEMYQHRVSKNIVEYYVFGKIKTDNLDQESTYMDYDMTIILYENEFIFSVKPGVGDLSYEE